MQLLNSYAGVQALAALLLAAFGLLVALGANGRAQRQGRAMRKMMSGPEGADLEAILKRVMMQSDASAKRNDDLEARVQTMTEGLQTCVSRVGFVRFDAYPDVSGKQSFSLAMLDGRGDGAILTGLFGRTDGRCFGKGVAIGQADAPLSDEESEALRMAMSGERYDASEVAALNGSPRPRAKARR